MFNVFYYYLWKTMIKKLAKYYIVVLSVLIFYVTINLKQKKTMHQQKKNNAIKITKKLKYLLQIKVHKIIYYQRTSNLNPSDVNLSI